MSKVRKVYNLRKTSNMRSINQAEDSRVSNPKQQVQSDVRNFDNVERNLSSISQNLKQPFSKIQEELADQYQVEAQELVVDKLQLNFNVKLGDIERKEIKIKNIGNSAVYLQFVFKNTPKINSSGFKDTKLKFYCHYQNNVIKPAQENTFIFSFLSQFPGNFTEQVQIVCQPPLKTKIPNIKLCGRSFILDQWQDKRSKFHKDIHEQILKQEIRQILSDVVDRVKLPPPPKPDVSNPKVAEVQFQKHNKHLNLFYNQYLHKWFDEVFQQICEKNNIDKAHRYWDQSVQTLKDLVNNSSNLDDVQKKCFQDRIQHYCYLSMAPLPNKSQLYGTIYEFVSTAAYHLGGDYVDAARKELDMWQVPFREPTLQDTPQQLKLRKEEVDKIKAQWVKKAKKKKWGAEQQAQMVNEFKKKAQAKTTQNILNRFTNFEEKAEFIKANQFLQKSPFSLSEYQRFLERLKTIKQYSIEGKKVMIKWNLKLKDNCEDKLKELEEYLTKKKQQEKRLQQEKKNEGGKKKKAPPKQKKKGQKQEQQQKPLFFDFMSILDQENWNGFTETFRVVMEKQPFLVFIGITYGPRAGRFLSQYSVHFLLQHLKALQSSIDFFPHQNLPTLSQRIQTQSIAEGSVLLLQNLNFLPYEVTQQQVVSHHQDKTTITKRKLLHPEIREFFDELGKSIDVLINQDRYLTQISGFSAYLNKQVILGSQWWKYVGLSMRVNGASIVFGDDFTSQNYILLSRLVQSCSKIYLTGLSGLKFYMVKHKIESFGTVVLTKSQKEAIQHFLSGIQSKGKSQKIALPLDLILSKEGSETIVYNGSQSDIHGYSAEDIGPATIELINNIHQGHLFILGEAAIKRNANQPSKSLVSIIKALYKKQQHKKERHSHQSSTPLGINYNEDLVTYLIGISESQVDKIELRDKKKVKIEQQGEQAGQEEQEGEADKKKIDMVSDFHLASTSCLYRLWRGKFDIGLKDISKYQQISD